MKLQISLLKTDEVDAISAFAKSVWYEHYSPIIGEKQVKYMLEKFQNADAIKAQLNQGYQYFRVTDETGLIGYFSTQIRKNASLFISKFYLAKQARGKGVGKKMLTFIEKLAQLAHCKTLNLTVNKYNPAYKAYLKLGFTNQGSVKFDIGNGYIMDDYLMGKPVYS